MLLPRENLSTDDEAPPTDDEAPPTDDEAPLTDDEAPPTDADMNQRAIYLSNDQHEV